MKRNTIMVKIASKNWHFFLSLQTLRAPCFHKLTGHTVFLNVKVAIVVLTIETSKKIKIHQVVSDSVWFSSKTFAFTLYNKKISSVKFISIDEKGEHFHIFF